MCSFYFCFDGNSLRMPSQDYRRNHKKKKNQSFIEFLLGHLSSSLNVWNLPAPVMVQRNMYNMKQNKVWNTHGNNIPPAVSIHIIHRFNSVIEWTPQPYPSIYALYDIYLEWRSSRRAWNYVKLWMRMPSFRGWERNILFLAFNVQTSSIQNSNTNIQYYSLNIQCSNLNIQYSDIYPIFIIQTIMISLITHCLSVRATSVISAY